MGRSVSREVCGGRSVCKKVCDVCSTTEVEDLVINEAQNDLQDSGNAVAKSATLWSVTLETKPPRIILHILLISQCVLIPSSF